MSDNNENTAGKIKINFAESMVDGQVYEGPREPQGFRALAKDGYYKVAIEEAEPGQADSGNATLNLVVRVIDKDEEGAKLFGNVTCTGMTNEDKPRPNMWNLLNLLLSTGRTKEQLDAYATGGKSMELGDIAASLVQEGKNVGYVKIRHEIAKMGKMAGKEVARTGDWILAATYEKRLNDQGLKGIRWDKKTAGGTAAGANHGSNGTTAKSSFTAAEKDALAAKI